MTCCGKRGVVPETVDVDVALGLKFGANCNALDNPGVWPPEISSPDSATVAKLVGSVRTDVSLGVSEAFAFTGTGAPGPPSV